mmetsp:Transcript_31065/g.48019  ORF Transcript_31065/g.48019 Transcript_31065/m.48019 type:complete len:94 (-) Transcript_31065:440-721(-)
MLSTVLLMNWCCNFFHGLQLISDKSTPTLHYLDFRNISGMLDVLGNDVLVCGFERMIDLVRKTSSSILYHGFLGHMFPTLTYIDCLLRLDLLN